MVHVCVCVLLVVNLLLLDPRRGMECILQGLHDCWNHSSVSVDDVGSCLWDSLQLTGEVFEEVVIFVLELQKELGLVKLFEVKRVQSESTTSYFTFTDVKPRFL